ncbi:hypothetical protein BaRGS_00034862, partial [Batillaria attramentaria]
SAEETKDNGDVDQKLLAEVSDVCGKMATVVQKNKDDIYTFEFNKLLSSLVNATSEFAGFPTKLMEDCHNKSAEYLTQTDALTVICDVIVDILNSGTYLRRHEELVAQGVNYVPLALAVHLLWNFTHYCDLVTYGVRDHDRLLPVLLDTLRDWNKEYKDGTLPGFVVDALEGLMSVTHNTAMRADNVTRFRQLDATMITLADIVTEEEADSLATSDDVARLLLDSLRRSLDANCRTDGFQVVELTRGVGQLARNDNNSRLLVKEGALPLLLRAAHSEHDDETEVDSHYMIQPTTHHLIQHTTRDLIQPTTPDLIQPTTRDLIQPTTRDLIQPTTRDLIQPTTRDLIQPTTRDLIQPTTRDLIQPTTRDLIQPTTRDLIQPTTPDLIQPTTRDLIQPTTRDLIQPTTRDLIQPTTRDLIQPTTRDLIQPTTRDLIQPTTRDLIQPTTRDLIQPTTRDLIQHTTRDLIQHTTRDLIQPTTRDLIQPTTRDLIQPTTRDFTALKTLWMLSFHPDNKEEIIKQEELLDLVVAVFRDEKQTKDCRKSAEGILWELRQELKTTDKYRDVAQEFLDNTTHNGSETATSGISSGHVMLSYQWANQALVKDIRDHLKQNGFKVWMDIDDLDESTLQGMADAVEGAAVVLTCVSQKYKDSPNCRAEAEYAFHRRKPIVPIVTQQGYRADGWLGIILGSKMFYDFSGKYPLPDMYPKLVKAVRRVAGGQSTDNTDGHIKQTPVNADNDIPVIRAPSQQKTSSAPTSPSSSSSSQGMAPSVVEKIRCWTKQDVAVWLTKFALNGKKLEMLTGEEILLLCNLRREAPEYFYNTLEKTLDVKPLSGLVHFLKALDGLPAMVT